jgi:hypothetical protein
MCATGFFQRNTDLIIPIVIGIITGPFQNWSFLLNSALKTRFWPLKPLRRSYAKEAPPQKVTLYSTPQPVVKAGIFLI